MFEVNASRQSFTQRFGRITAGFALLVAAFALSQASVIKADDLPPTGPPTPEVVGVSINYIAAESLGQGDWLVQGIVAADDLAAVTIRFGGCTSEIAASDAYGYFSIIMTAQAGETLTADATDGVSSSHAEVVLTLPLPEVI